LEPPILPAEFDGWLSFNFRRIERAGWLLAVLVLALLAIMGWMQHRDETARGLDRALASVRCPAPNAPLEQFLLSIASEADGGKPTLTCVYITSDMGIRPKLRYSKPVYAQH